MKRILSIAFLVLFSAAMLVSCDDDLSSNNEVAATESPQELTKEVPSVTLTQDEMILLEELSNKSPKRSVEQAVEVANDFFGRSNDSNSLSKRGASMPKCEALTKTRQSISKSGNETEDVDTLLYVLNYDGSYAVVSADIRVPDKILAYSEEGNFDLNTDNPGIQIFLDMAQDYIDFSIKKAERMRDSLENALDEKIQSALGLPTDTTVSISKSKRVTSKTLVYTNHSSKHISTEIVGPYVTTYWNQNWPYNRYVPSQGGKLCPAGCVAVAFSQLMAYWKWPIFMDNGNFHIWSCMLKSNPDSSAIANLIWDVGARIRTDYDTSGSGAFTEDAIDLLEKNRYVVGNLIPYTFSEVQKSIDEKCPVIIDGLRWDADARTYKGHCWLIDGYAKESWSYNNEDRYVIMYKDDVTGVISGELEVKTSSGSFDSYYQHFHLGWKYDDYSSTYYSVNTFYVKAEYRYNYADDRFIQQSNPYKAYDYAYKVRIAPNIHPKD